MYTSMKDEENALVNSIDKIWNDIKEQTNKEFASQKITSSWKNSRS
jgi:hypothetical protein